MNQKNKNLYILLGIVVVVGIGIGMYARESSMPMQNIKFSNNLLRDNTITVYKSPLCGCCVGYIAYLKKQGFKVEVETVDDMQQIKDKYAISRDMQSCHTSIIGDYFIEGHVPVVMIDNLLANKPTVDGIALPGMLPGSPGMPGIKRKQFSVYALTNGKSSLFNMQ